MVSFILAGGQQQDTARAPTLLHCFLKAYFKFHEDVGWLLSGCGKINVPTRLPLSNFHFLLLRLLILVSTHNILLASAPLCWSRISDYGGRVTDEFTMFFLF